MRVKSGRPRTFSPRLPADVARSKKCIVPGCIQHARVTDPVCWPHQAKVPKILRQKMSRAKQNADRELMGVIVLEIVKYFEDLKK